jgi:hypothetical protein
MRLAQIRGQIRSSHKLEDGVINWQISAVVVSERMSVNKFKADSGSMSASDHNR